jgi:hypothetical protein
MIEKRIKHLIKVPSVATFCIAIVATLFLYLAYFKGVPGDFNIYFNAAKAIRLRQDPYIATNGGHGGYIYGPFLACALSLLSSLSALAGAKICFLFNITILVPVIFLIKRLWSINPQYNPLALYISLILSFSVRNNFGNGQVMILVAFLALAAIYMCNQNSSPATDLFASLYLVIAFELKPYLILAIIALLIFKRRFRLLLFIPFVIFTLNLMYFYLAKVTWFEWFSSLRERASWVSGATDQASLFSTLQSLLNLDVFTASAIALAISGTVIFLIVKNRNSVIISDVRWVEYLGLTLPCILSPFMHSHDFLFVTIVVLSILSNELSVRRSRAQTLFIIFLSVQVNWTNENLLIGLLLVLLYFSNIYLNFRHINPWAILMSFFLAVVQTFLIHVFSDSSFVIYNFCSGISGLLGFFILIQGAKTSLRASTLSAKVL